MERRDDPVHEVCYDRICVETQQLYRNGALLGGFEWVNNIPGVSTVGEPHLKRTRHF